VHVLILKTPNAFTANRWGISHVSAPNIPGTSNPSNNKEDVHTLLRKMTIMSKRNHYKLCKPLLTTTPHNNMQMKYWATW